MLNDRSRLDYLVHRYASNTCTRQELLELLQAIEHAKEDGELQAALSNTWNSITDTDQLPAISRDAIFNQIIPTTGQAEERGSKKPFLWLARASAAIVFLVMGFGLYQYITSTVEEDRPTINELATTAIVPGGDKAILTLANGAKVFLDDTQHGELAAEGTVRLLQADGGQLIYRTSEAHNGQQTMAYNALTTPRGGQYRLVLDDGTKVWVNASSSIRYPISFAGEKRTVELTGEAYFEVAEDKEHPFVVIVNGTRVEVLGTHFNVMGYPDEERTSTTLLEGSVKVVHGKQEQLLLPGQQAIIGKRIQLLEVDPKKAIAWKEGRFNFAGEQIETIMRKISRWYNIEVVYEGNVTKEELIGTVPRSENLREVLNTLALTGLVHFKIEGRRVTVMP